MARPAASNQPSSIDADIPLVGRDAELATIRTAWQTVLDGKGRLVLLSGEPGIGKTRLAEEVLVRTGAPKCVTLIGRCFEQQSSIPFFPFSEAFAAVWKVAPQELIRDAAERWQELGFIVPDLLQPTGGTLATAGSEATQLRVFERATQFLVRFAEIQPIVLLLDDLHWADATSLGLLLYLLRHLANERLLIVGTYRDVDVGRQHPLDECLRELVRERIVDEIHLTGLDHDGTGALVRARFGDKASDEFIQAVHNRTGGNPFFAHELLKALREQSVRVDGQSPALDRIEIPRSVRTVVAGRVARLTPGAQEVLALASVIGQQFDLEVVLGASKRTDEAVLFDELDAALAAGLIKAQSDERRERYAFSHALVQQTLYREIPIHRRRRLHRRVGEVLEALTNARSDRAADLASHFRAGGDFERATRYGTEAGDRAAARYAHAEAVANYQAVLDLLVDDGDSPRAAEVRRRLGDELYDLNRLPDALAAFDAALATFERLGETTGQALVHRSIGRLHQGRYDMASAVEHLDAALRLWPSDREDAELVGLLLNAARARFHAGLFSDERRALAERGFAIAERIGDPSLVARALVELARFETRGSTWLPLLDRAEKLASSVNGWRVLHLIYLHRGATDELTGELQRSLVDRMNAASAADRVGETERVAFAYRAMAGVHLALGSWDRGRAAARAALELDPQRLLDQDAEIFLAWMEGRHRDALEAVASLLVSVRERENLQGLTSFSGLYADFALQLGRCADVQALIREAAELVRVGTGRWGMLGNVLGQLAETVARLDTPDADQVVDDAEQQVRFSEQYLALPQLLRARSLLLRRRGERSRAVEVIQESARTARAQHARVQLGRSLFVLSDLARANGDTRVAREADDERRQIVADIGPEALGLDWTKDIRLLPARRANERDLLSPREYEVVALVTEGRSNREIAEMLVISERTAEKHVSTILSKLGFDSRAQVAVWATRHHLPLT
jgi:DNA-binding NarL/FixJ family response regulator